MFFPPLGVKETMQTLYPDVNFFKVKGDSIVNSLLTFEKNSKSAKEYKFGVLYQRAGQKHEDEIYGNNAGSLEFLEFLEFLGERIELKNWSKFRGGLNTTSKNSDESHK